MNHKTTPELLALKIPAQWAMLHNHFTHEPMMIENEKIINDLSFQEDVLSLQQIEYKNGKYEVLPTGYFIDLGWYPESDPNGTYRLVLGKGNWNNIVCEYHSQNKSDIQNTINTFLANPHNITPETKNQ